MDERRLIDEGREEAGGRPPRLAALGGMRGTWGCVVARVFTDPITYFLTFWVPLYLQQERGFSLAQLGAVGWVPFAVYALGNVATGAVRRALIARGVHLGRARTGFSPEAKDKLLAHPWPGNVGRELRNAIERAVLLSEGTRIEASDLRFASAPNSEAGAWRPALPAAGVSLDDVERGVVMEALERHGFVQKEAAAWLGVPRRKLNYMIQRMGVTHPSWRRNREDVNEDVL